MIGADSVHNIIRPQMWDYASTFEPEDYGMTAAETSIVYGQGMSKLLFQQRATDVGPHV